MWLQSNATSYRSRRMPWKNDRNRHGFPMNAFFGAARTRARCGLPP